LIRWEGNICHDICIDIYPAACNHECRKKIRDSSRMP
jgi:hypothetical protein